MRRLFYRTALENWLTLHHNFEHEIGKFAVGWIEQPGPVQLALPKY
jgi:hypothetical protein